MPKRQRDQDGPSRRRNQPDRQLPLEEADMANTSMDVSQQDDTAMTPQDDGEIDHQTLLHQRLANSLVRLALSCEFARVPLRRQAIRDKILAEYPRAFRPVFERAQQCLQVVFGMEMQPLPAREKLTIEEKRKVAASQSKSAETWIVVSILPDIYRDHHILQPNQSPNQEAEAVYSAFYTTVISLIAMSGGELTDAKLRKHLTRLNAKTYLATQKTDDVLARIERHGYVTRRVVKDPSGSTGQDQVSWLIGPRGKKEVGDEGIAMFVRKVYGPNSPGLDKKIQTTLGIQDPPETGPPPATQGTQGTHAET